MSHVKTVSLILAFVLAASSIAMEENTTKSDGNALITSCQATVRSMDGIDVKDVERYGATFCLGLVEGIGWASPDVCLPDGVVVGQEIRVVVKYLNDHPEKLNLDERVLTHAALASAFPCTKKK